MFLVLTLDLTLIFVQNLSLLGSLHETAECADFSKVERDPVGVAGGVAKLKVAYNLALLTGNSSGVHVLHLPRPLWE